MKILFVSESLPYPLDRGGYIRSAHLIRELARQHEITLLTQAEMPGSEQGVRYYQRLCQEVICLPKAKSSGLRRGFYLAGGLLGSRPYPLNKNFSRPLLARLKQELQHKEYQVLHCDHLDTAQYLPSLASAPKSVFDTHNLLSVLLERLWQQEQSPAKRAYLCQQWRKIRAYELTLLEQFDLCLVCSEQEKKHLSQLVPQAKVAVIPNGVNLDSYQISSPVPHPASLLFIGSLDYLPNSQGVLDFYHSVWPLVRKQLPQVRWQIIGRNPPVCLQRLAQGDEGIDLISRADDMRPYLAANTLMVVPLRIGGGTRIKILEAMAAGLAVVSTAVGAEGIGATDGREIVIADEPQAMAQQIVALCRDDERRQQMAQRARCLVAQYDWQVVGKTLLLCYNTLFDSVTASEKGKNK